MPILCAIVGATGVGKTKTSLAIAKAFQAEIISMDSRQVYRGFRVGTAQPSREAIAAVPHHLVDFLPPEERFSAGDFVRLVKRIIETNPTRSYILVGGTGLYLQALTEGLAEIPQVSGDVRRKCEQMLEREGSATFYERILKIDPESATVLLPQDRQRMLRAFEVFLETGRKFSEIRKCRVGGIGKVTTFWLARSRESLYRRIDARVLKMIEDGWKEEVVNLYETIPQTAPAWQSLGYREWAQCLEGKLGQKEVIESVQKGSRHYAKRQLTWFRHQTDSEIVNLDEKVDSEQVLLQMSRKIGCR